MADFVELLRSGAATLPVGEHRLEVLACGVFGSERQWGVTLGGYVPGSLEGPADYLGELLLGPDQREATYGVVNAFGMLRCLGVRSDHQGYRAVRAHSSRGRLSQGECYHHDGCSGPVKPRVVEIRLGHRAGPRHIATAVAPFAAAVEAMVHEALSAGLYHGESSGWAEALSSDQERCPDALDRIQGHITRSVRRQLDAEEARSFFRGVDERACAFRDAWEPGESRLISNAHPIHGARGTMQHRRAYCGPHLGGVANSALVKRWPAEELL
ncbi:MAG: hypothetical protein ACI9EF_004003 [Pseudohongiellaceae bacterium]